jgi:16S rRNA (adenine1518-N6/adenine1519-N6)-dimethyltransferase
MSDPKDSGPLTLTRTRGLLQSQGHHPQKALGQNFLVDPNLVRKSLELGQVRSGDHIVEVGPGLGTLSSALLQAGADLWAVEKDPRLAAYLRDQVVPQYAGRFHLTEEDALKFPRAGYSGDNFKIIANLPYAISTPWMEKVIASPLPSQMVLMLQKEAADRFTATHDTKQFGVISILLDLTYRRRPGHAVSRHCFYPQPDVDSVLLVLERLPQPRILHDEARILLRSLFGKRRKQALSLLKKEAPTNPLAQQAVNRWQQLGIPLQHRAEQISSDLWWQLLGETPHP